jgi:hypothetical protein
MQKDFIDPRGLSEEAFSDYQIMLANGGVQRFFACYLIFGVVLGWVTSQSADALVLLMPKLEPLCVPSRGFLFGPLCYVV